MVGFIEPVGTQFQSATADLSGNTMMATKPRGLIHSRHKYLAARCNRFGTRMKVRHRQRANVHSRAPVIEATAWRWVKPRPLHGIRKLRSSTRAKHFETDWQRRGSFRSITTQE